MSFYNLPHPWNPGFAIPDYVMAEPPERGTFTTQWLPRGTIPALVPDYLAKPGKKILGRNDAGLGSLGGCSLAGSTLSGHTLRGSSLGADESAVKDPTAPPPKVGPVTTQVVTSADASPLVKVAAVALTVGVAYMIFGKKKRR